MNSLTGIYGAASALRNQLFDRGVLTSRRLDRPVVSVGNLSVGGVGKTPFVIALGELLKARGIRFDVLSRGYGRKTRGVLVVDPNGSPSDFGDEPLLIARRLAVPVVVGESRYQAGRLAEKMFDPQLHILDDGFQHRSLARDFDIVLLSDSDFDDRLLPSGRLREPLVSLQRADAIVLPVHTRMERPLLSSAAPAANVAAETSATENVSKEKTVADHPALRGKLLWRMNREIAVPAAPDPPIVFCGIARPEQFFAQVRAAGTTPAAEVIFPDHHAYRQKDIERLQATRAKRTADESATARGSATAGGFLTTEKDAINLGPLQAQLNPLAIATLTVVLDNPTVIVDTILARIGLTDLNPQDLNPGAQSS